MELGFQPQPLWLQSPGGCSLYMRLLAQRGSVRHLAASFPRLDKVSLNTEILGHCSRRMGKHSHYLFIQRSATDIYLCGLEGTSSSDAVFHPEER